MRIRILVLATAVLLFGAIMTIPRIIGLKIGSRNCNFNHPIPGTSI